MSDYPNTYFDQSDSERDEIISKLSDDILLTNIREQLASPMLNAMTVNDVLSYFDDRYEYIVRIYCDDRKLVSNCKMIREKIYTEIYEKISTRYGFNSQLPENPLSDDFYFYIREMYVFFVINYKKNFVNFFTNFIYKNIKDYVKQFKSSSEKKDLLYKSLKKTLGDSEYIHVIYNLEEIIRSYIELNQNDFETVLITLIEDDPYEITLHSMNELFIENKYYSFINGYAFIDEFFRPFSMNEYKFELIASIRNELFTLIQSELIKNYEEDGE